MVHPLAGCDAKLDRAREHLGTFAQAHSAYFNPRPFEVRKVYDAKSGWYSFVPVGLRQPPLRIGVVLGDLVHNLRSALDHLVWQAVLRNGHEPNNSHQFPICEEERFWRAVRARRLRGVADEDTDAIRQVQPFTVVVKPTPLTRLREISNEDKHRLVTPTVGAVGSPAPVAFGKVPLPPQMRLLPRRDVGQLREAEAYVGVPLDGTVPLVRVKIVATGPNPDIDLEGQRPAELMLSDGGLLRYVINDMATTVDGIINDFGVRWVASQDQ
jgi:hypothetical protein